MRKQQSGKIINITSMGGKIYTPLGAWYHATKHALEGWSDCLRIEVKQFGIDVVIIEPGIIATEFGEVMFQPMLDRSGKGPYRKMAESVASATKGSYEKGGSSPASVIANLISKAINSKKPKTRYVAGKLAKPLMFRRHNKAAEYQVNSSFLASLQSLFSRRPSVSHRSYPNHKLPALFKKND